MNFNSKLVIFSHGYQCLSTYTFYNLRLILDGIGKLELNADVSPTMVEIFSELCGAGDKHSTHVSKFGLPYMIFEDSGYFL